MKIRGVNLGQRSTAYTCCNDVVDDEHSLAGFDAVSLNLKEVFPILLLECSCLGGSWEFSLLSHRHKAGTELQCQAGAEQEASCLECDDDIWGLFLPVAVGDLQFERSNQRSVKKRIGEERKNVFEEDSRRGKVGVLAAGTVKSHPKIGEFGGAGGGGGGVSFLGGFGGIWAVMGRMCRGRVHDGEDWRRLWVIWEVEELKIDVGCMKVGLVERLGDALHMELFEWHSRDGAPWGK